MNNRLINDWISLSGFSWDGNQNIFVSRRDAWQSKLGYFTLYDIATLFPIMKLHCEPIRFGFGGKSWKIEFWKGRYGPFTGAEVGIYTGTFNISGQPQINHLFRETFASDTQCARKPDWLQMSFVLKDKHGHEVFRRNSDEPGNHEIDTHWWLTGFKLEITNKHEPSDLSCDITIFFGDRNIKMMDAFVGGLTKAGYTNSEFQRHDASFSVTVTFSTPHAIQPAAMVTDIAHLSVQRIVDFMTRVYPQLYNYTVAEIAYFVILMYQTSADKLAEILFLLGLATDAVADFLRIHFNYALAELLKLLYAAGYGVSAVAGYLNRIWNYGNNQVAGALHDAGYAVAEVGNFFNNALSDVSLAKLLRDAGYETNKVGNYFKSQLQKTSAELIAIMFAAGYSYSQVVNFIKAYFHLVEVEILAIWSGL
jgi:Domain of unknown function (DUF4474)